MLLLAAVTMAVRTSNDKEMRHRAKVLTALRRVKIRSLLSAQPDNHGILDAPLGNTAVFTASISYILDHYGHARSRKRASARRGEARLYDTRYINLLIAFCSAFRTCRACVCSYCRCGNPFLPGMRLSTQGPQPEV